MLSKDGEPLRYLGEGAKDIEAVNTLCTTEGILGEGKQLLHLIGNTALRKVQGKNGRSNNHNEDGRTSYMGQR